MWLEDLRRAVRAPVSWLWQGYLASGRITLLTSQWKSGKTTRVAVLLAWLQRGGALAGRTLALGKAVILSEESPEQWDQRSRKLDFGDHLCWFCRLFRGKPRRDQWLALVDRQVELRTQQADSDVDIIVVMPARSQPDRALPEGTTVKVVVEDPEPEGRALRELLLRFAGTAPGLASDLAAQHDHYVHGTPTWNVDRSASWLDNSVGFVLVRRQPARSSSSRS